MIKLLKICCLVLLLVPNIAMAQVITPGYSRRTIVDESTVETPKLAATSQFSSSELYGLGAVLLIIVALLAAQTLSSKPHSRDRKL